MDRGIEPSGARAKAGPPTANSKTAELDLDRLVWDPEYRAAMRPLIERKE